MAFWQHRRSVWQQSGAGRAGEIVMAVCSGSRDLPWRVRWAAWQFSSNRGDYYDYVAACLDVQARHRSLLEFLQLDAQRHTGHSHRAVLARWWADQYLLSGANLTATLRGTLPAGDVACLELAQSAGLQALLQMLRALARQRTQIESCQKHFLQTILAGLLAVVVALLSMSILPGYTFPKLVQAFSVVSPQQYGPATRSLASWVDGVLKWGVLFFVLLIGGVVVVRWSLSNWTAALRDRIDGFGIWRIWRDLQAAEFLALTATLVQTLGARGVSLRSIIQMQVPISAPYRQCHLLRMLVSMDLGMDSVAAMDTGMIDRGCLWRLQDMVHGYGLTEGYAQASQRVLETLVQRVARQALLWRVLLLTCAVVAVMWMGYWHAQVIDEMRQALLLGIVSP